MFLSICFLLFAINDISSQECRPYSTNDTCDPEKIKCYSGGEEIVYDYEKNKITKRSSTYSSRETTTLILHGIDQNKDNKYIQTLVSSYDKAYNSEDYELNVLICDFSKLVNKKCYEISEGNLDYIGSCLAKFIYRLRYKGLFIVGYDIGALLMTTFARHFPEKVTRTTALDPGFKLYGEPNLSLIGAQGISIYRDCIHTAGNKYAIKCGTVDFFVNLEKEVQPGCLDDPNNLEAEKCSHLRSLLYFNESINNPDAFWGYKCEYVHPNRDKNCPKRPPYHRMGEHMEGAVNGFYEVDTNAQYPFGKGMPKDDGTKLSTTTTAKPTTTTTKPTTTTSAKPTTTTMKPTTTTTKPTTPTSAKPTTTSAKPTTTTSAKPTKTTSAKPTKTTSAKPTTTTTKPTTPTSAKPTTTSAKPTTTTSANPTTTTSAKPTATTMKSTTTTTKTTTTTSAKPTTTSAKPTTTTMKPTTPTTKPTTTTTAKTTTTTTIKQTTTTTTPTTTTKKPTTTTAKPTGTTMKQITITKTNQYHFVLYKSVQIS